MKGKVSVLVFPCGAENGLEIYYSLKDCVNITLFGASGKEDHGSYVFRNYLGGLPNIADPGFIDYFTRILVENEIDVVFPTHDDVALFLAASASQLPAQIIVPGLWQAEVCRSKKRTYQLFEGYPFTPKTFGSLVEATYPLFAKPDKGQGGKGAFLFESMQVAERSCFNLEEYVLCEFLPGEEVTVDCFSDRHGALRFIGPRSRDRVFGGISLRSTSIHPNEEISTIAQAIHDLIKPNGLWYFQAKQDEWGQFKLLEISVRASGTMNLYRMKGINFPLLSLYNALGYDVEIAPNSFSIQVDRALINRYRHNIIYHTVYIDFDDTITTAGEPNPEVVFLLYNLKKQGKQIILITRHAGNIYQTLDRIALHKNLFLSIIQMKEGEEKYQKIKREPAVFIDNIFRERWLVQHHIGIPVFDVDAAWALMDWRN